MPVKVRPWLSVLFQIRVSMGKSLQALLIASVTEKRAILPGPTHRQKPARVCQELKGSIFDTCDYPRTPEKPSLPPTHPTSLFSNKSC